jgi:hypothetical protein
MGLRHLTYVLVLGCGGESLTHVAAPPGATEPLQLTGSTRFELWIPLAPSPTGARVAHTRDGGANWREIELPMLRGEVTGLVADNRFRAWVTGTTPAGTPGLVAIIMETGAPVIEDHSRVFPANTTDVLLATGGYDPDPMITARVDGAAERSVFLLRESLKATAWIHHPQASVRALLGIYTNDSAYFVVPRDGTEVLTYCILPDDTMHCIEVPAWKDSEGGIKGGFESILPSAPTPKNDWLWRSDPQGGELVRRSGDRFDMRRIEGWPDPSLAPVRFFALESGELGVLAVRDRMLEWVTLDSETRVVRTTSLASCDDCLLDPTGLVMLPDAALAIPSPRGWYVFDPRGL